MTGERLQGIEEGRSSPPHLANSLAASFPGKKDVRGFLITKGEKAVFSRSAKEFEVKEKTEERTE